MTHALPVAFYLNDVDGDTGRRGPTGGMPGGRPAGWAGRGGGGES